MESSNPADVPAGTPTSALIKMFYDPMRAFAMLERRHASWLPLLLCMLTTIALMYAYYSMVDFEWMKEKLLATIKAPDQRAQAMTVMTRSMIMTTSVAAGMLLIPLTAVVAGVYFMIAAKVKGCNFDFGKGFALVSWSLVPMLLTTVLGFMQLLLSSNGQLEFSQLNPSSVNQLFFQFEMAHTWAGLLDSINIATLWQFILLVTGFQVFAKVPRTTAIIVTLLPYIFVYGIWIAYNMSQAA